MLTNSLLKYQSTDFSPNRMTTQQPAPDDSDWTVLDQVFPPFFLQKMIGKQAQPAENTVERLEGKRTLPTPTQIKSQAAPDLPAATLVLKTRRSIERILRREDHRLLVVVGPCSIHDSSATLEYGKKLAETIPAVQDSLLVVMRTYLERPESEQLWPGYLRDPLLGSYGTTALGIERSRQLLCELLSIGVPLGIEVVDPLLHCYIDDLVSLAELDCCPNYSATHIKLASGLPYPVGFKNDENGALTSALQGIATAADRHSFLSLGDDGRCFQLESVGNPDCFLVMRGGEKFPNYDRENITAAEKAMIAAGLNPALVVDCSHYNSGNDPARQTGVLDCVLRQIEQGCNAIRGVLLESNLSWGNQPLGVSNLLRHGVSITDGCIDWATTEKLLVNAAERVRDCRAVPTEWGKI